jgi:starch synthase/alpha-amylase
MAYNYEEARSYNPVDFLVSGIFSAHFVNTVSPRFLEEIVQGRHDFIKPAVYRELTNKWNAGCASGILNAPDSMFSPGLKKDNFISYTPGNHVKGKEKNKLFLQKSLGLVEDKNAPLFFWPSRLDPVQKGCQLLADILYSVVSKYWEENFQVVFVANGEYQVYFKNIVDFHKINRRVAVCDFDEKLAHLAYGASDFVLMPSSFEPCGLPQMIGAIYGALPVANNTGGIHDTIAHLDEEKSFGNGFLFNIFDSSGLFWAIDQAMDFFKLSGSRKKKQIHRIMEESAINFSHDKTAKKYIALYEKMLNRPLIK